MKQGMPEDAPAIEPTRDELDDNGEVFVPSAGLPWITFGVGATVGFSDKAVKGEGVGEGGAVGGKIASATEEKKTKLSRYIL